MLDWQGDNFPHVRCLGVNLVAACSGICTIVLSHGESVEIRKHDHRVRTIEKIATGATFWCGKHDCGARHHAITGIKDAQSDRSWRRPRNVASCSAALQ